LVLAGRVEVEPAEAERPDTLETFHEQAETQDPGSALGEDDDLRPQAGTEDLQPRLDPFRGEEEAPLRTSRVDVRPGFRPARPRGPGMRLRPDHVRITTGGRAATPLVAGPLRRRRLRSPRECRCRGDGFRALSLRRPSAGPRPRGPRRRRAGR